MALPLQNCFDSTSKSLKLFQFGVIFMIVISLLLGVFPEEIQAIGKIGKPLEEIGVPAPKEKLLFVLADALSYLFTNSEGPAIEGSIEGRFTIFMEMLRKEPENTIFRKTHVEGPTFTRNGVISLQTGAIPS